MKDIQSTPDQRGVAIDQVGITELRYPIRVRNRVGEPIDTVANISMSVHLPHHFKGTHMSRFLEILTRHEGEITSQTIPALLDDLRERLDAESAHVEVAFPYFLEKSAPVSGARAKIPCDCTFIGTARKKRHEFLLRVRTPIKTLCPCSKEISDYGAHNQRGLVTIEVQPRRTKAGWDHIWIEELVDIAEASGSAPVYALLKRPDERHVTMQAYDNPVFVEDVVRNVAVRLMADPRVAAFHVQTVNQESIHAHDAFARVVWKRR